MARARLRPVLAGVAVAVSAAGAAQAADGVTLRTRAERPGDVYRYRSETRFSQSDDQGRATQSNATTFEIEVLDGDRRRLRLIEGSLEDSAGPAMGAALRAAVGGVLTYRIDAEGRPVEIEDWPAWRSRFLARVDAELPAGHTLRALIHQRIEAPPLDAAREFVLGDVLILTEMEPKGPLALGPGASGLDVSVVEPGCVVALRRDAARSMGGLSQSTVTDARLSAPDGRVLSLEQRKVTRGRSGSQDETVVIRRISAPPPCR